MGLTVWKTHRGSSVEDCVVRPVASVARVERLYRINCGEWNDIEEDWNTTRGLLRPFEL